MTKINKHHYECGECHVVIFIYYPQDDCCPICGKPALWHTDKEITHTLGGIKV